MGAPKRDRQAGKVLALLLLLWLTLVTMFGCASGPQKESRVQAMAPLTFSELQKDPDVHEGRKVVFGGYILELRNEPKVSLLIILQVPLDFQNRPNLRDQSEGRFVARTKEFLEPEIYKKDRRVTVRGKVTGTLTQALGDRVYQYPVIEAEAFHLWTDETYYDWRWDRYWDGWGYSRYPLHRPMRPSRWQR